MSRYDVIVAGGGWCGCLQALSLKSLHRDWNIALVEKESFYGGRVRSGTTPMVSSCGLNLISTSLVILLKQKVEELTNDTSKVEELFSNNMKQIESVSVCSAGELKTLGYGELFGDKGMKTIGGAAALRDWSRKKDNLWEKYKKAGTDSRVMFSKVYEGSLKDPCGAVLDIYAQNLGIPSLGSSLFLSFMQRLQQAEQAEICVGQWSDILSGITALVDGIDFMPDTLIVSGTKTQEGWQLKTQRGLFETTRLVVAQSPWEALNWLDQNYYPPELLSIALKAKPVSVVSLTHSIESTADLNSDIEDRIALEFSDMILVPSEQVSVINTLGRTLSYQTPVDYEMFLDAPVVSKAVRRLKRAKKKLMSLFPDIKTGNDFISLIPAGWTQIISQQSRQMPGSDLYNTEDLGFSGDSYGESFCPDENIARSVEKICSNFS